jgi:hypothetical protein
MVLCVCYAKKREGTHTELSWHMLRTGAGAHRSLTSCSQPAHGPTRYQTDQHHVVHVDMWASERCGASTHEPEPPRMQFAVPALHWKTQEQCSAGSAA